jgi:hypothetical protein
MRMKPDSGKKRTPRENVVHNLVETTLKKSELRKALAASEAKIQQVYEQGVKDAIVDSRNEYEAKHKTEIKKLWEYFRKQMARKQMKLAESEAKNIEIGKDYLAVCVQRDNLNRNLIKLKSALASSEKRIISLQEEIVKLKKELELRQKK